MNIDRRIAYAIRRIHRRIDSMAQLSCMCIHEHAADEQKKLVERFHTAARSVGQFRRHRKGAKVAL